MSAWIFTRQDIYNGAFGDEPDKGAVTCHFCWCLVKAEHRERHGDVHVLEQQARGHILRSEFDSGVGGVS